MAKTIQERFMAFLEEHKAREAYEAEIDRDFQNFEKLAEVCKSPGHYIDWPLYWARTAQGHDYWWALDKLWRVELEKIQGDETTT